MANEPTARFVYHTTPRTLLDGQDVRPALDVNGNIIVTGSPAGGGIPVTPQTVTLHTALLGASATQAIPTGAKGYLVVVITGTATINATASVPAGVSLSDVNTLAAGFSVVTASASSAFVAWNT